MMGGDIDVKSDYGKGSTFSVTISQKIRDNTPIANAPRRQIGRTETTRYFSAPEAAVLIVDDIPTNLKTMEGLLFPYKMQVDICDSGTKAIELTNKKEYDIVFLDHMIPDMDGIEAVAIIRKINEYYQTAPIVALTANGFIDFLAKPVEISKLNEILADGIKNRTC